MIDGIKIGTKAIVAIAVGMIVILLLASMWVFGYGFFTDATSNRSGKTEQKQQINGNGQYRIAAYDHFYDACAAIQTDEQALISVQAELRNATDAQRKTELDASVTALQIKRSTDINQYNVDARKSGTLGQFKSSDLPFKIDPTVKETSCTA